MTPHKSPGELAKSPRTPAPAGFRSLRFRFFFFSGLLLCAIASLLIWWFRPWVRPTAPPKLPPITDKEVKQAVIDARQGVIEAPNSAEKWGRLGKIFLAHLFDKDADYCFAEASRLDPGNPMWFYARGLIASKRRPAEAMELLAKAVDVCSSDSEHRTAMSLQLADIYLEREMLDMAEKIYAAEQVRNPKNHRAAFGMGVVKKIRGDESAATRFLKIAQASPSAKKKAISHLAALARSRGDDEAADRYEIQAAKLPADHAWPDPLLDRLYLVTFGRRARERHAAFLESESRYAEAAETYLQQIEIQPIAGDYVGAGINLARLRLYDRALPLLRKAIELDDDSAMAHYTLALVMFSRAEQQMKESPNMPQPKKWLQEVVQHAKRATELKPDDGQAYLFWGLSLKYLGDSKAAIEPLRKGTVCLPDNFDLQFYLGEALLDTGRRREAKLRFDNASRIRPEDARLASALMRLGKNEESND